MNIRRSVFSFVFFFFHGLENILGQRTSAVSRSVVTMLVAVAMGSDNTPDSSSLLQSVVAFTARSLQSITTPCVTSTTIAINILWQ